MKRKLDCPICSVFMRPGKEMRRGAWVCPICDSTFWIYSGENKEKIKYIKEQLGSK